MAVCASRHVQVVKQIGSDGRMQSQTIALTTREERVRGAGRGGWTCLPHSYYIEDKRFTFAVPLAVFNPI